MSQLCSRLLAQIPWYHNCVLLDKVKDRKERALVCP